MFAIRLGLMAMLALASAAAAGNEALANGKSSRIPVRGCVRSHKVDLDKLRSRAEQRAQRSYEAALRRRGLRKAKIGSRIIEVGRGYRAGDRRFTGSKLVTATIQGVSGRWIPGGSYWTGSAGRPVLRELVTDGKGTYYFATRVASRVHTTNVALCGCAQRQCRKWGSGCPGCGATMQIMYGPFGPTDRFAGEVTIRHSGYAVRTRHARGICTPVRKCPPPPPSRAR